MHCSRKEWLRHNKRLMFLHHNHLHLHQHTAMPIAKQYCCCRCNHRKFLLKYYIRHRDLHRTKRCLHNGYHYLHRDTRFARCAPMHHYPCNRCRVWLCCIRKEWWCHSKPLKFLNHNHRHPRQCREMIIAKCCCCYHHNHRKFLRTCCNPLPDWCRMKRCLHNACHCLHRDTSLKPESPTRLQMWIRNIRWHR